ncbi:Transposase [Serratia ficaria]|nr:Transposase [Serratia ficaria]CAI1697830.1 Transposase [Serratia ficaria]
MGTPRFTPEFKEEAVRQITERGYSVAEVSDRLGVLCHCKFRKKSSDMVSGVLTLMGSQGSLFTVQK